MGNKNWFLKRWFLQGVAITLPLIITMVVFYYGIIYTDAALWFLWDLLSLKITKPSFPGVGLFVFTVLLIFIGSLTESFIANKLIKIFNNLMSRLPIIRNVYSTVLKVAQSLFGNKESFSGVVLIEYPKKDTYAIAFKTKNGPESLCKKTNKKLVSIFIPTTPNPTSGFYLLIPEEDIIDTDITTEEAFKLIISAGIVQE